MLPAPSWECAWTERQGSWASHLGYFMFRLVVHIHLSDIDSLYWEKLQRLAPCHIVRISLNGASTMFSFSPWVIYVPIGCRHPFVRYWQPWLRKTTVTCSLPHPENERQRMVNDFYHHILSNLCSDWLQRSIYQILAAFTGKNYSAMLPATSWKWASPEHQQFVTSHFG